MGALRRRDNTRGFVRGNGKTRRLARAITCRRHNDLTQVFARRVLAIDPHDTQRERKAFRVFLESVPLAEFGSTLMNDAGFHQLVDEVQQQMELTRIVGFDSRSRHAFACQRARNSSASG